MTLKGKYNTAEVYTDVIDETAITQIIELCNQPMSEGAKICIMPDVHAGAGCTIGTTMTLTDKVIPNLVGVDIGCGMYVIDLQTKELDYAKLDRVIHERVPSGRDIREVSHKYASKVDLSKLACKQYINETRAEHSLGTLGGGNHFIEVDKDKEGNLYLVIHTGSRHLGLEVAGYYQEEAYKRLNKCSEYDKRMLIDRLKAEGKHKQIQSELAKLQNVKRTDVPKALAYCEGVLFEEYIHDMKIVQEYAVWNRKAIAEEILKGMDIEAGESFTTIHNYIDTDNMILRKGAVSAQKDEKLIIPINMRDGSLLCKGKGNAEWNCSAPHGAGRLYSRSEAKQNFTVEEYAKEMEGIYTTSVNEYTIDECPMTYKSINDIVGNVKDTVEILDIVKPVYNFKASEQPIEK